MKREYSKTPNGALERWSVVFVDIQHVETGRRSLFVHGAQWGRGDSCAFFSLKIWWCETLFVPLHHIINKPTYYDESKTLFNNVTGGDDRCLSAEAGGAGT